MEFCSPSNLISINALLIFSGFCLASSSTNDAISSSKFIRDPEFISSNDSMLKLGFFTPENSTNRYVGIWYLNKSNVIWVANRNQPLIDSSGIVTVSEDGNLVILNGQKQAIWSSNVSNSMAATNSSAQLLDSGNLVLLHETGLTIWESFKHPCDTFIPNMRISTNKVTGEKIRLVSWKSPSDPSLGMLSVSLERLDLPEIFAWNETRPYWRSGPWNGRIFIGSPQMYSAYLYGYNLGEEEDGTVYLTFVSPNQSYFATLALLPLGNFKATVWENGKELGTEMLEGDDCDVYGKCGAFGSCNIQNSPICSCLVGFEPRNSEEWNRQNWTNGCVRKTPLQCERMKNISEGSDADGFSTLEMMKVPDFAQRSDSDGTEDRCRSKCLDNCSCVAYAYDAGIGCMYWSGDLIDIRKFPSGGVDLYIRVASSELGSKRDVRLIIIITGTMVTLCLAAFACLSWKLIAKYIETHSQGQSDSLIGDQNQVKLDELPLFDYKKVAIATNNFHTANKLGQGGFGAVYKGEFQDGQEIAVKRLSRTSGQGQEEFMNEVMVISKLQHRNLVRLLGCCVQADEKMLIYEFMSNKSLDAFLFDSLQKKSLDWRIRFIIIEGIARGLLYLHRDSRLKIIHRDLKASNILLDAYMNPKISDFGLAKIFEGKVDEANTRRIAGTYGYMSPEYAMKGLFSEKSDVYSFGVLLLEIVSGRRNASFANNIDQSLGLLEFAWKLWNEGNITSLIDAEIRYLGFTEHILRCIHIGLLCVEEVARERPAMAVVVSMLNSEIVNLPPPRQPAFVPRQILMSSESLHVSNADLTVTKPEGR